MSSFTNNVTRPEELAESSDKDGVVYAIKSIPISIQPVLLAQRTTRDIEVMYQPKIVLLEEPEEKFRFRYKSEMNGTHGCIHGKNFSKKNKTFPTIQVTNVPSHIDELRVRCGLYVSDNKDDHHVHKLMWKPFSDKEKDFVEANICRKENFTKTWQGLGIIHTSRKNIENTIFTRKKLNYTEEKARKHRTKDVEISEPELIELMEPEKVKIGDSPDKMNTVHLGFEVFHVIEGINYPLCIVFSQGIKNLKNPTTSDLKITKMSISNGSVDGGDEIIVLTERVKKGDIKIRFFEENERKERTWQEFADFDENAVHHQYAICFKTPAYRGTMLAKESVRVYFELYRPSDEAVSEKKTFTFEPIYDSGPRKKRRISELSNMEGVEPIQRHNSELASTSPHSVCQDSQEILRLQYPLPPDSRFSESSPYSPDSNLYVSQEGALVQRNITMNLPVFEDISNDGMVVDRPEVPGQVSMPPSLEPNIFIEDKVMEDSVSPQDDVALREDESMDLRTSPINRARQVVETLSCNIMLLSGSEQDDKIMKKIFNTLEYTSRDGNNTLHTAVLSGQKNLLEYILDAARRFKFTRILEEKNMKGDTPLHMAVKRRELDMTSLLLEHRACVNTPDQDGNTPIHLAVMTTNSTLISIMLNFQADPNIANHKGLFPIHLAAETGFLAQVIELMEHGARKDVKDLENGQTPLHIALRNGHEHIVEYLVCVAKVDTRAQDGSGETAINLAKDLGVSLVIGSPKEDSGATTSNLLVRKS